MSTDHRRNKLCIKKYLLEWYLLWCSKSRASLGIANGMAPPSATDSCEAWKLNLIKQIVFILQANYTGSLSAWSNESSWKTVSSELLMRRCWAVLHDPLRCSLRLLICWFCPKKAQSSSFQQQTKCQHFGSWNIIFSPPCYCTSSYAWILLYYNVI